MLTSIKDFFNFNKRQERGVFVLSFILIIVILLNYYSPELAPEPPKHISENAQYLKQVKLQALLEENSYKKFTNKRIKTFVVKEPVNIHSTKVFDLNSVSFDELKSIGLPEKIARNIQKYRNSGGYFYKKEDLKKIYGMTNEIYIALEPFINTESKNTKKNSKLKNDSVQSSFNKSQFKVRKSTLVDVLFLGINSADSAQLLEISGVGPFYAGSIVKYRRKLGGYNDIRQLNELFKMDSSKYNRMKKQLYLDTIPLQKININTADFKTILKHPYIDYETTKYIANKRNRLGKYAAVYQLKDSVAMPDSLYFKILPYITIN